MKQFKKWWEMEAQNIVGVGRSTEKDIAKTAWDAALEFVLSYRKPYYDIEDKKVVATDSDIIYKELEE